MHRNFSNGEWEHSYGDAVEAISPPGQPPDDEYYYIAKKDSDGNPEYENYDNIFWAETNSTAKPSKAAVKAKFAEIVAAYATNEYARNRKIDYDKLNQFELMTDDAANSTTTHADAIAAVKEKWPKDNSGPK